MPESRLQKTREAYREQPMARVWINGSVRLIPIQITGRAKTDYETEVVLDPITDEDVRLNYAEETRS